MGLGQSKIECIQGLPPWLTAEEAMSGLLMLSFAGGALSVFSGKLAGGSHASIILTVGGSAY